MKFGYHSSQYNQQYSKKEEEKFTYDAVVIWANENLKD